MYDTVVKNGRVVIPEEGIQSVTIGIRGGKVAALLAPSEEAEGKVIIDAKGLHVLPGVIDPHVHLGFGDPETDFYTESRAAAIGGVTTLLSYLMTTKPYDDEFKFYKEHGEEQSIIDFGLHAVACTDVHQQELQKYVKEYGITSYKFFMSFRGSEGEYLGISPIDDGFMYEFLAELGKLPRTVACIHTENIEVVWRLRKQLMDAGRDDLAAWAESRPAFVEAEATLRAMYFGEETDCPIYVVHLSSEESLNEIRQFRERYDRVYLETCPHYLTHTMYSDVGLLGKQNPPLKSERDIEALWEGIADGSVDTIGSDHGARKREKKTGTIWTASPGQPNMPVILPVMLSEGVNKRGLSIERVVEVTSYNSAKIFNLYPQKGTIQVGSDADLTIVDLDLEKVVHPDMFGSRADYSIYEGWTLKGWPTITMVRGGVVMQDGEIEEQAASGIYLRRD